MANLTKVVARMAMLMDKMAEILSQSEAVLSIEEARLILNQLKSMEASLDLAKDGFYGMVTDEDWKVLDSEAPPPPQFSLPPAFIGFAPLSQNP